VISIHQRYRQTDRQTDVMRWHHRSIAKAWSGKKFIIIMQLSFVRQS